jgi:hypothetical protein
MSGYLLGDDGWGGGDAESADTRAVFAFGLGLTGAFLGFVLGAILAPSKETRVALW